MDSYDVNKEKLKSFMEDYHNGIIDISEIYSYLKIPVNCDEPLIINVLDWLLNQNYELSPLEYELLCYYKKRGYDYIAKTKYILRFETDNNSKSCAIDNQAMDDLFSFIDIASCYSITDILNNCKVVNG